MSKFKFRLGIFDIPAVLFFVIFFSSLLVGCSSAPKEKEIVVTEATVVSRLPPEALLKNCAIAAPPNPKSYVGLDYAEKEKILIEFAAKQTFNLGECNKDKAALRRWVQEQTKQQN